MRSAEFDPSQGELRVMSYELRVKSYEWGVVGVKCLVGSWG